MSRFGRAAHASSWVGLVLVAWAAAPQSARAQVDDFNDGNDAGWTQYAPLRDLGFAGASYTFPAGAYQIASNPSPNPGALGPARAGSIRDDVNYATRFYTAADVLNWGGSSEVAIGLLARTQREAAPGTLDGYSFTYLSNDGTLRLSVITNERASDIVPSGVSVPGGLTSGHGYRFVFTGDGAQLTGQVFDLANPGAGPLATITGNNSQYTEGKNGLVVFDNDGPQSASGTFDNYFAATEAPPVPEPTAVALLLLGVAGAALPRRRNGR